MVGETTSELVLDSLSLNNSGVYYCRGKFFDVYAQTNNATLEVYSTSRNSLNIILTSVQIISLLLASTKRPWLKHQKSKIDLAFWITYPYSSSILMDFFHVF